MFLLLVFGLLVVKAAAHKITYIGVPVYGNPQETVELVCKFVLDTKDPPLQSVKWYLKEQEFFRYVAGEEQIIQTFHNAINLQVIGGTCNNHTCSVTLKLPEIYNTRLIFTCEVSTEGPKFAVVSQTRFLTIAAILREDPVISVVPQSTQTREEIWVNCTTGLAYPPANIVWSINGVPVPWHCCLVKNMTKVSSASVGGLRTSWRDLRIRTAMYKEHVKVRCEAKQPTIPPYKRATETSILVPKSECIIPKITGSGSRSTLEWNGMITAIFLWCTSNLNTGGQLGVTA